MYVNIKQRVCVRFQHHCIVTVPRFYFIIMGLERQEQYPVYALVGTFVYYYENNEIDVKLLARLTRGVIKQTCEVYNGYF